MSGRFSWIWCCGFARLRQSSREGARILPVHPGTCLRFPKGWFWRMFLDPKAGTRVQKTERRYQKQEQGYKNGTTAKKNDKTSEQLPCRSAEVKFFSVFLCQRCREIWREILVKFSALRFPRFGCAAENFTKISRQKRCEKRKFHENFTLLGRSADKTALYKTAHLCFLAIPGALGPGPPKSLEEKVLSEKAGN